MTTSICHTRARLAIILLLALLPSACASLSTPAGAPRNVIFIVGDGMGSAHFTAARLLRGADFQTGRLPFTGLVATRSANSIATDSAAAASAYSTGVKANDHMLGTDADGKPVETAGEVAMKSGRAVGVVTTADFFDATPSAFLVHHPSRYDYDIIARQMLQSGAELIAGGGAARFGTEKIPAHVEEMAAQYKYALVQSGADLPKAGSGRVLVVFPTEKNEVDSPQASLPQLARWALDRLSKSDRGFFLVLENEGTDGSSHANNTEDFQKSVRSLDDTVGVALAFAETHPDTLVIVTGDHETGGLQIAPEKPGSLELRWSTKGHTGESVPLFAKGPGASRFVGYLENSEVGQRLKELLRGTSAAH